MAPPKNKQIQQSAALPILIKQDQLHLVLITSRKLGQWIIPKGHIEPGLSPAQSALNEALEEAGIEGIINNEPVGKFTYTKNQCDFHVVIFPMHVRKVLTKWDEMNVRRRKIVSVNEAYELIPHSEVIKSIKKVLKNPSKYLEKL